MKQQQAVGGVLIRKLAVAGMGVAKAAVAPGGARSARRRLLLLSTCRASLHHQLAASRSAPIVPPWQACWHVYCVLPFDTAACAYRVYYSHCGQLKIAEYGHPQDYLESVAHPLASIITAMCA